MNSGKSSWHGGVFNYPEPKNLNLEPGSNYKKKKSRAENHEVWSKKNSSTISHRDSQDPHPGNYYFTQSQPRASGQPLIEDDEAFIISDGSGNSWLKAGKKHRPKYKAIKNREPSSEERKSKGRKSDRDP